MDRLLRIGLIVTLFVLTGSWVAGAQGVVAQGTTWTDSMDSAATGLLSGQSPDEARFAFGYQNGQFVIQSLQQGWSGDLFAYSSTPVLSDARVAVDFSIAGDLTGKYAFVGCRDDGSGTGYMLEAHPDTGRATIWRYDPDNAVNLGAVTDTSVVHVGSANNRIEIICQGNTITGIVNGSQLLTAQDATYGSGDVFIGAGKNDATTDLLMAGFDNLSITDLGTTTQAAQPTQPAQSNSFPAAIPVQPTQAAGFPTAIPEQPATGTESGATLADPRVDPDLTLTDAFLMSLLADPIAGPSRADDTLANNDFKFLASGVNLADLYTSISFITPPQVAGSWAVGFAFWSDEQSNYHDMFIQVTNGTAKWGFGQQTAAGYQLLQSGELATGAVDFTPGAENYVGLAVVHGVAILAGNDLNLAATVDMGDVIGAGDVKAEVGFLASDANSVQTLPVSLANFRVWDLSPAAVAVAFASDETPIATEEAQIPVAPTVALPPTQAPMQPTQAPVQPTAAAATGSNMMLQQIFNQERSIAMAGAPIATLPGGTLQQQSGGFGFTPAGVASSNVYVTATFVNPTDLSTSSDSGIGIRDLNDDTEFRFVVRSDGSWVLAIGTGAPIAQGTLANFDATPGGSNTLEIIAHGATGLLAVNGVVAQQVDLSANLNAGDVYIATGMYGSDSVDGRQVPYSNFQVYQLGA